MNCQIGGFAVADLTNHDDVRVLAQQGAQAEAVLRYTRRCLDGEPLSAHFQKYRDQKLADDLVAEQKELRAQIKERWPELKRTYRDARSELTSHENWGKIFDAQ